MKLAERDVINCRYNAASAFGKRKFIVIRDQPTSTSEQLLTILSSAFSFNTIFRELFSFVIFHVASAKNRILIAIGEPDKKSLFATMPFLYVQ